MIRLFSSLSLLFLAFLTSIFGWLCWDTLTAQNKEPVAFCGVASMETHRSSSPDYNLGKSLFRANCAACHAGDMKSNLTGPALGAGIASWETYPEEDLYAWIRNSQAMIAAGHPRAVAVWNDWAPTVMNNFQNLTDEEIAAILGYVDDLYRGK